MKKKLVVFILSLVLVFEQVYSCYALPFLGEVVAGAISKELGISLLLGLTGVGVTSGYLEGAEERKEEFARKLVDSYTDETNYGEDIVNEFNAFLESCATGVATIGDNLWAHTCEMASSICETYSGQVEASESGNLTFTNASGVNLNMKMISGSRSDLQVVLFNCSDRSVLYFVSMNPDLDFAFYNANGNLQQRFINPMTLSNASFYWYTFIVGFANLLGYDYSYTTDAAFSNDLLISVVNGIYSGSLVDGTIAVAPDNPFNITDALQGLYDKLGNIGAIDVTGSDSWAFDRDGNVAGWERTVSVPGAEALDKILEKLANGELTYEQAMEALNVDSCVKTVDTDANAKVDSKDKVTPAAVEYSEPYTTPVGQRKSGNSEFNKYMLGLSSFFPFCIPYDFINLIKAFYVPAKTPKFSYTIRFDKFDVDWDIELNLSKFDTLAYWCRIFETIIFIFALMKLTKKIMKW